MMETQTPVPTTLDRLRDLEKKNESAFVGGGSDRVTKHKQGGRLTARERILDVLAGSRQLCGDGPIRYPSLHQLRHE